MNDDTGIIEAYTKADFEKRLYYFLSYRSLRDRFTEIDNRERQSSSLCSMAANPQAEKRSLFRRWCLRWGIHAVPMK